MESKKIKKTKNNKKIKPLHCPVTEAVNLLKGRWRLPIIYSLMDGKKRFKELERSITGINTRMLVKELKALQNEQFITRKAYPTVPPKVEYALTEKGESLDTVIDAIKSWSLEHLRD